MPFHQKRNAVKHLKKAPTMHSDDVIFVSLLMQLIFLK